MDFYLHESTVQQYFTLYLLSTALGLHTGLHSKSKPTIIFISEGRGSTLKKKKKMSQYLTLREKRAKNLNILYAS